MAKATWNLELDGRTHEVVLEWGYFGGKREVTVDGQLVGKEGTPFKWWSDQEFDLHGHRVSVVTRPQPVNFAAFDVELHVDDRVLKPDSDEH